MAVGGERSAMMMAASFEAGLFSVICRLDFRRLPGPVLMSAGSFSRTAAGNRAYVICCPFCVFK